MKAPLVVDIIYVDSDLKIQEVGIEWTHKEVGFWTWLLCSLANGSIKELKIADVDDPKLSVTNQELLEAYNEIKERKQSENEQ